LQALTPQSKITRQLMSTRSARELPALHREIKERVKRTRASIERYFEGVKQDTIEGDVLKKT